LFFKTLKAFVHFFEPLNSVVLLAVCFVSGPNSYESSCPLRSERPTRNVQKRTFIP